MNNNNNAILITGSSSGIGNECVKLFASKGFKIFAGVRTSEDAEMIALLGNNVTPIIMDVTDQESIDNAFITITKLIDKEKFHLINNAGMAVSCPVEFVDIDKLKQQFDVNVFGQIRLIKKFLPILRKTKGRIINISSFLSTLYLPYTGPYCASKAALNAINAGLKMELNKWDIDVVLVMPGIIKTPIWSKSSEQARKDFQQLEEHAACFYGEEFEILTILSAWLGSKGSSSDIVAKKILHIVQSPRVKSIYHIGNDAIISNFIRKFPQKILDSLIMGVIKLGVLLYKKRVRK